MADPVVPAKRPSPKHSTESEIPRFLRESLPRAAWTADRRLRFTWSDLVRAYRAVSELTSDIVFSLAVSPDGSLSFEWATEGLERIGGYSIEEVNQRGPLSFIHPDDLSTVVDTLARSLAGESAAVEHRIVTRAGAVRWLQSFGRPERNEDGRVVRIYGGAQDITERKVAEEKLRATRERLERIDRQRLALTATLVHVQEDERKRIAEGIHDDSIQIMATVGLRLGVLTRRVDSPEDRAQVEELQELVERSVARLRTLLFELSPPELKRAGLAAAVMELLRKMATEEPRPLAYEVANQLDGEAPEETQILLYRMAQEALTNVRKHAQASRVDVAIGEEDGGVLVEVRDDGVGFSTSGTLSRPGHLGLAAMRERAEMARGWWAIDSTPGEGTAVRFWLPLMQDRPHTA